MSEQSNLPIVLSYKDVTHLKEALEVLATNQNCSPFDLRVKIVEKLYLISIGKGKPFTTYKELAHLK